MALMGGWMGGMGRRGRNVAVSVEGEGGENVGSRGLRVERRVGGKWEGEEMSVE